MSVVTARDRLLDSFRKIVASEIRAVIGFPAVYEYSVQSTDGVTIDAAPTNTEIGLPQINKVKLTGDSIATFKPKIGGIAHIIFLNGDRQFARCIWCEPAPDSADIAGGGSGVARTGDGVRFVGTITAPPGGGVCTIGGLWSISGGSSKVTCG